jgi:hypothetical protein
LRGKKLIGADMKNRPLTVSVENDEVVIRIGVDVLAEAAELSPVFEWDDDKDESKLKVTDKKEFAKSVVEALWDEGEVGNTLVTEMFDKAFEYVSEQGLDGFDVDKLCE